MRLFIRTEASNTIGMGHFMRCYAIAEAARAKGIPVVFLLNEVGEAVAARLKSLDATGISIAGGLGSVSEFMALAGLDLSRKDWLVIDSYQASEDYIRTQAKAVRVAVIDDLCALEAYPCDLLINSAMSAHQSSYRRKTAGRLLLGADFALVREEFSKTGPASGPPRFLTVMFGGSDPNGLTQQCAEILHKVLPDCPIQLIVGPANRHTEDLTQLAQTLEHVELCRSPENVAHALAGSDLVITAAGGSVGEVAAMGLPALVLVAYDNQVAALSSCPFPVVDVRLGLPVELGEQVKALMADPDRREHIAREAHRVVDGMGPQRVLEAMLNV